MSKLARRAETIKLARLLRVQPAALKEVETLDAASLREFRQRAAARLFDADEARLKRVALASKLLPTPLIALIGEHVFGALLCARVAGLIAPDRAADVALRLKSEFLADVTLEIDPRHVREVIARIPIPKLVEVALILARRGEFVTLARFVDYVSTDAIRAVMAELKDNAALLHIAFFMEDKSRLNDLVGLLPEARLREIIYVAADETQDLWAEALALMNDVDDRWRKSLGELAASLDESVLLSMARSAQAQKLWGALLPIIAIMDAPHQRRLLGLSVLRDDVVLESILEAADGEALWPQLLPMLSLMDEDTQQRLARAAEKLGDATFGRVFDAVQAGREWGPLLILLLRLRGEVQDRLKPLVQKLSPEVARQLLQEADRLGVLTRVDTLWQRLSRP
ncbi:hypothetical protein [Panacagrimonas sp.]|uniref:hypothetical protein n=1 Tax=Panacagrimonas sp. TaxID=2480088 RepID=UPI003B524FE6